MIGGALLLRTFLRTEKPLLRQQLKWIIWGLGLSGLPFAMLYLVPYVLNLAITPAMEKIAYGPLILIPLSFGYSIVRYRLMDVDVIMRRSFVHAMASIAVAAIYMAMLLGVGDLVRFIWATADLNSWRGRALWLPATQWGKWHKMPQAAQSHSIPPPQGGGGSARSAETEGVETRSETAWMRRDRPRIGPSPSVAP